MMIIQPFSVVVVVVAGGSERKTERERDTQMNSGWRRGAPQQNERRAVVDWE